MTFQLQSVSLHKSSAIVQNDRKYNIYRYIKITTKAPSYAAYASQLISPNLKNKLQWDEYVSGLERSKLLLLADNENSVWAAYSHLESHDRPINQREEWKWQKTNKKTTTYERGGGARYTHAIIFPYRFFMRFSSFLAESQGADCPSKKLYKQRKERREERRWNTVSCDHQT